MRPINHAGSAWLLACTVVLGLHGCASMPDESPREGSSATSALPPEAKASAEASTATEPPSTVTQPVAPQAPVTGQWEGRLSLKLGAFGQASSSGSQMAFELDVKGDQGTLSLSTPLGTRMAMVRWQAGLTPSSTLAQLETADGTQAFDSLQDLTQQLLGEALPLQAMLHWLQGHPSPDLPFVALAGQNPETPRHFVQAGWRVDASELNHGRLDAQREASSTQRSVTLRLRLDL